MHLNNLAIGQPSDNRQLLCQGIGRHADHLERCQPGLRALHIGQYRTTQFVLRGGHLRRVRDV